MVKITTMENGDVTVEREYFDGQDDVTSMDRYCIVGSYVHKIYPNGTTGQICKGLRPTGPTLMAVSDRSLEDVIRKTLFAAKKSAT